MSEIGDTQGPASWAQIDAVLRAEADALLDGGLRDVLAMYGGAHLVVSYMMKLMAWRDLDVHFGSADIHEAVLDHGVRSVESFWTFLNGRA